MLSEQCANYPYMIVNLKPHYRLIECKIDISGYFRKKTRIKKDGEEFPIFSLRQKWSVPFSNIS